MLVVLETIRLKAVFLFCKGPYAASIFSLKKNISTIYSLHAFECPPLKANHTSKLCTWAWSERGISLSKHTAHTQTKVL